MYAISLFQVYACLMVFFISNAIEGQLISTGAFEVVFNGKNINSPGLECCH